MADEKQGPLQLLGAGVLGALAQWILTQALRVARPVSAARRRDPGTAALAAELRQMNMRLETIEGTLAGMDDRLGLVERRRAAGAGD